MKSEERHRLQETELEKLGRYARDFWESFIKGSGKILLVGIGVVALVAVVVAWYFISSANAEAERWKEVITASFDRDPSQSLVQLADAAAKYSEYPAGQWAALMEAERALSEGIRLSRTNRPASVEELLRARDAFAKLATTDSDIIQERRAFGMARTLEALAGVDVNKDDKGENVQGVQDALAAYEKFVEEYPESIFKSLAENRIKALKSEQIQDFYAWYRQQYPRPEDRPTPEDGGPSPGSGLPSGHPPISPGQMPPTGPSFPSTPSSPGTVDSQDSMINELESFVEEAEGKPKTETGTDQPSEAEKSQPNPEPPKGPSLTPPNPNDKKPAEPAPAPKAEDKNPAEPAPAKTESTPE